MIFSGYFYGGNGAAIGAFHQAGWIGLIADLIPRRHEAVAAIGDVVFGSVQVLVDAGPACHLHRRRTT